MKIINKPEEPYDVQCYKCKTILKAHPLLDLNSPFFTDCSMHSDNVKKIFNHPSNEQQLVNNNYKEF